MLIHMIILSQRNPKWAREKLGASSLTLGRWGCTTTSISMLTDYFNGFVSPVELAHNAANYTQPGHPQGEGLVIWEALKFPTMKFDRRERGRKDSMIQAALKDPDRAVILQVNNGAHWVVALSKTLIGNDYRIADPWDGKKKTAISAYHNITGAAYFSRK